MSDYALVQDNTIVEWGPLPGIWVHEGNQYNLQGMSDSELAALGWLPVVETDRPPNAPTTAYDMTVELVNDIPTQVWTARPATPEESEIYGQVSNADQLKTESGEAIAKLELVVTNLNLITNMTNATINNNPAAVIKDLARECKTIARQAIREARLTSGELDSASTGPPD